jgi:hypothetical protein
VKLLPNNGAVSTISQIIKAVMSLAVEAKVGALFINCHKTVPAVAELPRFKRLVKVCRLVGEDFVISNCKIIGGELLDVNYENTYSLNKTELLKEAKVFGFAWMEAPPSIKCL